MAENGWKCDLNTVNFSSSGRFWWTSCEVWSSEKTWKTHKESFSYRYWTSTSFHQKMWQSDNSSSQTQLLGVTPHKVLYIPNKLIRLAILFFLTIFNTYDSSMDSKNHPHSRNLHLPCHVVTNDCCIFLAFHLSCAGVVSRGEGCAYNDRPGVFTRVSRWLDWIEEHTAEDSCEYV